MANPEPKHSRPKLGDVCRYGGGKQDDEFVGIRYNDGDLKVYFPYGYSRPPDSEKEYRKDILNLVSVLSAYSKESEFADQNRQQNRDNVQFPIHAYLHVFNYFLNYGYYTEREPYYKCATGGKISWARTIKQVRPQIAGETPQESAVYLNFVTRKFNGNENEVITQIHKFCVYESYEKIGCLFGFFHPERPRIPFNAGMFAAVLKSKISRTFNERHLLLFRNMLDIVCYLGQSKDSRRASFGTSDFEYVWEGLIDDVFGIDEKEKRAFYPHCSWIINNAPEEAEPNETRRTALRPDTIMLPGDRRIFILDAKYYQYGEASNGEGRDSKRLPGTGSIVKQIAYAEFVESNWPQIKAATDFSTALRDIQEDSVGQRIFNAFVLPYNAKVHSDSRFPMENFGYAACNWKNRNSKPYNKIYGIFLDVRSIMQRHPRHSDRDIAELAAKVLG